MGERILTITDQEWACDQSDEVKAVIHIVDHCLNLSVVTDSKGMDLNVLMDHLKEAIHTEFEHYQNQTRKLHPSHDQISDGIFLYLANTLDGKTLFEDFQYKVELITEPLMNVLTRHKLNEVDLYKHKEKIFEGWFTNK